MLGHCDIIAIHLAKVTIKDFRTDHLRDKETNLLSKGSATSEKGVSWQRKAFRKLVSILIQLN